MELKISYESSDNKLKDGWKVELEGRYAYLSPGEVLEFLAAVMLSGDPIEYRLRWLKTEEEHQKIDSLYLEFVEKWKSETR